MPFVTRIRVDGQGFSGAPAIQFWDFASDDFTAMTNAEADGALAAVRAFYDSIKANFTTGQQWTVQPAPATYDIGTGDLIGTRGTTSPAPVNGTTAAGLGPQQVAILVQKKTQGVRNNRLVRGRSYLGPFQTAVTAGNQPAVGTINGINAALATLLTAGAANWQPIVWSRPLPPSTAHPSGVAGAGNNVSSWSCSLQWATQRRRNFV